MLGRWRKPTRRDARDARKNSILSPDWAPLLMPAPQGPPAKIVYCHRIGCQRIPMPAFEIPRARRDRIAPGPGRQELDWTRVHAPVAALLPGEDSARQQNFVGFGDNFATCCVTSAGSPPRAARSASRAPPRLPSCQPGRQSRPLRCHLSANGAGEAMATDGSRASAVSACQRFDPSGLIQAPFGGQTPASKP